jgi:hypothetical protein
MMMSEVSLPMNFALRLRLIYNHHFDSGTIAFVRTSGTGSESLSGSINLPYSLALRRTACGI